MVAWILETIQPLLHLTYFIPTVHVIVGLYSDLDCCSSEK